MIYTHHIKGECEAFRLLRIIISGTDEEVLLAKMASCRLLHGLRQPKNMPPIGRPLGVVTTSQLREIARLDAQGGLSQRDIALAVGVKRANVSHHLRPSKAMMAAMLQNAA